MLVFVSSKVTTASAFSRLTFAWVTPLILVNDLCTEITQSPHVIPETESVTVLVSANAAAEATANMTNMKALTSLLIMAPGDQALRESGIAIPDPCPPGVTRKANNSLISDKENRRSFACRMNRSRETASEE